MRQKTQRKYFPIPIQHNFLKVVAVLAIACSANAYQAIGQENVADTPAAKQFSQVLASLNESNDERREKIIRSSFDDSDKDLKQVVQISKRLHAQFGSVTFQKELVNTEKTYGGVCLTENVGQIELSVDIDPDSNLIVDVSIEEHDERGEMKAVDEFTPIISNGKSIQLARGVWHAKGYGYVLHVKDDSMTAYNYSGNFGWKIDFYDNLLFKPLEKPELAQVTLHPLEPGYTVTRLEELPAACAKSDWTETELFDAFADIMTSHYPFFEVRGVDWQARIKEQRSKVKNGMSERDLFDAMAATLKDLKDGHVSLNAELDGKREGVDVGRKGTSKKLHEAFKKQSDFKSSGAFTMDFLSNLKKQIQEKVLQGRGGSECNNQLSWGKINDKVGYIYIGAMYGYGSGGMSDQVDSLHKGMDKILSELADSEALIVDISMNPGGTDAISVELASHFADKKRIGFSKWPAAVKAYRNDRYVVPYSNSNKDGVVYTKPVYLLQNDFSASAAEIFTMCMRSFPQVVTVGQPTEGALSDVLGKPLPNGWDLGISNEVYVDHEEVCYEGRGIPPQITMPIFGDDILNHDHVAVIQKVVEMAMKKVGQ